MSAALRALVVAATIVLLAYAALWAPKLSRIAELRAEKEQLTEQYGVKMNLAINLDLYRQQLRDLDAMFGQLLEALPDRRDRTFAAIAAAVRRHDVQLQVLQGDEK